MNGQPFFYEKIALKEPPTFESHIVIQHQSGKSLSDAITAISTFTVTPQFTSANIGSDITYEFAIQAPSIEPMYACVVELGIANSQVSKLQSNADKTNAKNNKVSCAVLMPAIMLTGRR